MRWDERDRVFEESSSWEEELKSSGGKSGKFVKSGEIWVKQLCVTRCWWLSKPSVCVPLSNALGSFLARCTESTLACKCQLCHNRSRILCVPICSLDSGGPLYRNSNRTRWLRLIPGLLLLNQLLLTPQPHALDDEGLVGVFVPRA